MEFLKYFITDEIYVIPGKSSASSTSEITVIKDVPANEVQKPSPSTQYPVCIISAELNEEEKKLLAAILNAIKLDHTKVQYVKTYRDISSQMVLVFGEMPEAQGLPLYKAVPHDDKTFLIADELSAINQDTQKKRSLWNALKQMFSV